MKILHISANPKPAGEAASKKVTEAFLNALSSENIVTTIDLYEDQPPFYDYPEYRNFWYPIFVPEYQPSPEEISHSEYALRHGKIFNDTDVLVITAPMWNFGPPAILKAWIDQIISPGLTFTMDATGPHPIHNVKKTILFSASGGTYAEGDTRNGLIAVVKSAFGFSGVKDFDYAWADGQNSFFFKDSAERLESAIQKAKSIAISL